MIPGNIDLTENLDFHKEKNTKDSKGNYVPWSDKHKKKKNSSFKIFYNNNINFTIYPSTSNIINYDNTTTYTYSYSYITTSIVSNNNTLAEYNYDIYYNNTTTDGNYTVEYDNEKYHSSFYCYDCDKIHMGKCKKKKYINELRLPWYSKHKKDIESVSFKKKTQKSFSCSLWDNWDQSYNSRKSAKEKRYGLFYNMDDEISKIPWLENLQYRIKEDYLKDLKEERDYTSYLNNLSWLRLN